MLQKPKRKFGNIYIDGAKICANPSCFEEVPENRVYCCPECANACKYSMGAKRKKDALLKYQGEYKVGSPRKNTLAYAVRISVSAKKYPPDFGF